MYILQNDYHNSLGTIRHHETRKAGHAPRHLPDPISRNGLNLYGRFIQVAGDLRIQWVYTLTDRLKLHFKQMLFIRRREV